MKLLLPVGTIFVAAASCCCCGDLGGLTEELEKGAGTDASAWEEAAEKAADAAEAAEASAPSAGASVGSGNTEGLCGRFKDDGMNIPSGLSVLSCGNFGGTESLLLQGSGSPKDACADVKSWATGKGWTIQYDVDSAGSFAVTLKETGHNMTIACSDSGGRSTVSVSITAG